MHQYICILSLLLLISSGQFSKAMEHINTLRKQSEVLTAYFERVIKKSEEPIVYACESGNIQTVQQLLDEGYSLETIDPNGQNCLAAACKSCNTSLVRFVLEQRPLLIDHVDRQKNSVLARAVYLSVEDKVQRKAKLQIMRMLLDQRTSLIKATDMMGLTPLMACAGAHCEINEMQLLINHGADVNATDTSKMTTLHLVIMNLLSNYEKRKQNEISQTAYQRNVDRVFEKVGLLRKHKVHLQAKDNLGMAYTDIYLLFAHLVTKEIPRDQWKDYLEVSNSSPTVS